MLPKNFTVVTLGRFYPVSFKKRSLEDDLSDVDQEITEHALNILIAYEKSICKKSPKRREPSTGTFLRKVNFTTNLIF